jgi:Domain of unknown function (DUF4180)
MGTYCCPAEGKKLRTERDAVDVIGDAFNHGANCVQIPAERLDEDFFRLKTRVAGEFIQKFVNYRLRLVIVGDISRHLEESEALRDFVDEANRGEDIQFVTEVICP